MTGLRISCGMSWAAGLEIEPALAIIQRAGFDWVDLAAGDDVLADELADVVSRHGLRPAGLLWTGPLDADRTSVMVESARSLGLDSITVAVQADRRVRLADQANALAHLLVQMDGLDLELVNRYGSRLEQLEDFRELFVRLADPRAEVAIDTFECHLASVDSRGAVDELADRLVRLVLRDAVANRQVPIGTGEVNILSVLAHARVAGSLEWLVIDPPISAAANAARELADEKSRLEKLSMEI